MDETPSTEGSRLAVAGNGVVVVGEQLGQWSLAGVRRVGTGRVAPCR